MAPGPTISRPTFLPIPLLKGNFWRKNQCPQCRPLVRNFMVLDPKMVSPSPRDAPPNPFYITARFSNPDLYNGDSLPPGRGNPQLES